MARQQSFPSSRLPVITDTRHQAVKTETAQPFGASNDNVYSGAMPVVERSGSPKKVNVDRSVIQKPTPKAAEARVERSSSPKKVNVDRSAIQKPTSNPVETKVVKSEVDQASVLLYKYLL